MIINERGDFLQLIDFGLAHCDRWLVLEQVGVKKAGDCIGSLSNPNNLYFGSLSYVPDRALACDPGFIRSRDQWALGCMIYVCAYGRMLCDVADRGSRKIRSSDDQGRRSLFLRRTVSLQDS